MVTGEPIPVEKEARTGHWRHGQRHGDVRHERGARGADTLLAQIVRMVSEAQRSRAPIQRLADTVSGYFVPAVIVVAIATFAIWSRCGPEPRLAHALVNAVAVLIIACPCALGLATPMSIMVGTGRGAEAGVLIRNAEALEILEKVTTLVVDKTSTLTEGKPRLVTVVSQNSIDEQQLLRCVASLENVSEHPLAAAVVSVPRSASLARKCHRIRVADGQRCGRDDRGRRVAIGNVKMMESLSVSVDSLKERPTSSGTPVKR